MAAYVRHVVRDRAAALERLDALTAEYKAKAKAAGVQGHARTAGILGDLAAGFRLFAEWAASVGAIQTEVGARLADQHWSWLVTLADDQQEQQDESDDARRSASAAQVNQAVEAAYAAFRRPDWRKLTGRIAASCCSSLPNCYGAILNRSPLSRHSTPGFPFGRLGCKSLRRLRTWNMSPGSLVRSRVVIRT